MREAGLQSSSDSEGEEPAEPLERPSKRPRKSGTGQTLQSGQERGAAGLEGDAADGGEDAGPEPGFDYSAARTAAPGLDLGLNERDAGRVRGELHFCFHPKNRMAMGRVTPSLPCLYFPW